ncbi:MAG: FAD-binding protein [candidate division NC10 bacterium]|nr:FAD-binding protein [candidate division NC10 bacterium]
MSTVTRSLTADLRRLFPAGQVLDSVEDRTLYAYDGTSIKALPELVVMVRGVGEVSTLLRFASDHEVPVVPRGAGTGLSGGSVPAEGGIALVLAGMRSIKEIDAGSMVAVVEPGVITGVFQKTVEDAGMFYPPDPASLNYCTLGGNVAENAGGPHGVKYGVTKDYVLGLEVALPSGDVVRLGGKQIKNVTGYNLVQLFVGSEGTLGVITEITLRLLPKPPAKKTMLAIFDRLDDAATAVAGIMGGGVIPATLEIMDQRSINCVEDYLKLGLPRDAEAILLIEVDGMPAAVEAEAEVIDRICREKGVRSFQVAKNKQEEDSLWKARRSISPAISAARPSKIGEDISVPRSAIPAMVREIQRIAKEFDLPIVIFGHAGDGNLHPNILTDRRDHKEMERVEQAIAAIFEASVRLGGTLSGEHGIGLSKRPYFDLAVTPATVKLMADIKRAVDPKNILNPGKIWRA